MPVTLISGSPRKNENSEKIILTGKKFFQEKRYDVELIKLSEINTKFCIHCDFCKKNDYCTHDENANNINKILLKSDAIIAVSPIYFGSISGQLKTLFDKTLPLRRADMALKGKIGGAITEMKADSRNSPSFHKIYPPSFAKFVHFLINSL